MAPLQLLQRVCMRFSSTTAPAAVGSTETQAHAATERSFRVFRIPGRKVEVAAQGDKRRGRRTAVQPPRCTKMDPSQDWSTVWPTATTFKWSAIPFPVRQGFVENLSENGGIVPPKYANAELMKIPNFLHLTPGHIKKQCDAIKQFCTDWPAGLDESQCRTLFPVEVTTTDYCYAGPSVRDPRARIVRVKVDVAALGLNTSAEEKLLRLAGDRYDAKNKFLSLVVERCPLRKQNYDYAMYLLTALYHESLKIEPWESEKTVGDLLSYAWESSRSKVSCLSLLRTYSEQAAVTDEELARSDTVQQYAKAVENLHNQPETVANLNAYKESVLKLLCVNEPPARPLPK